VSCGASWYRTEKAAIIAANPVVLDNIRVCYERPELGEDCGSCEKCLRTKLNFYAAGVKRVPALGSPPSIDEIRNIQIPDDHFTVYEELLIKGAWDVSDPIRSEIVDLLLRYGAQAKASPGRTQKIEGPCTHELKREGGELFVVCRSAVTRSLS
jgi:hypothetical protein